VTLTATQREALTTMAAYPPERPYVLYSTKHGADADADHPEVAPRAPGPG
jgi:hypothetical protein